MTAFVVSPPDWNDVHVQKDMAGNYEVKTESAAWVEGCRATSSPSKGRREEVERFAGESHQLPIVGNGYGHEAMEVVRCLWEGRLESPIMPLDETRAIMETMDRLRAAWGVHLSKEPPWPTFTNPERRV